MMESYESVQARMEEQMRKAAVWRMKRAALDVHKQTRKNVRKNQRTGSWLAAISKALGGNLKVTEATDSFSN